MFDYEAETSYSLTIMAQDGENWDTVKARVSILSVDEFEPKIGRQTYAFALPSNAKRGTVIGKVTATDADGGEDGIVIFAIRTEQVRKHMKTVV